MVFRPLTAALSLPLFVPVLAVALALPLLATAPAAAQEPIDREMIARIRAEGVEKGRGGLCGPDAIGVVDPCRERYGAGLLAL